MKKCRRDSINDKARNAIGFVIVFAGMLMVIGGVCLLAIGVLRR